ncbi:MAG TPA: amidohydrolase family protein [Candidatus Binatia bacterium]
MPKRKLLFAAVFFLLSLCVSGGAAGAETIALYVDRLIDGNRVKAAGPQGGVEIPAGAKAVRTKGATAMPGLVDSHVHYKDWQGELYLNQGVTTALAIGSERVDWVTGQRDGIDKGKIVGPRIFASGPHLNSPRAGERQATLREMIARRRYEILVQNADEARRAVRELLAQPVDIIKVYEDTLPEAIKAAAEEAHKAGKPIGGHSEDVYMSVENGYDFVEHSHAIVATSIKDPKRKQELARRRTSPKDRMTTVEFHSYAEPENYDELVRFMVERRIHWSPTMATQWRGLTPKRERFKAEEMRFIADPNLVYLPAYFKANLREYFDGTARLADREFLSRLKTGYEKLQDFMRRFVRAGGKIQTGSDPNSVLPAWAIHTEMELFVDAGLTPMEAILAATKNPAEEIRRGDELGVIKAGSLADIVVVDGDPLEDITRTRRIKMVFKDGKEIKLGYHKDFPNPLPLRDGDRPEPEIDQIAPESATQGEGPVALTIEGGNFMSTSVAMLDGKPLPTRIELNRSGYPQNFDRARKLVATIPPALIAKAGTYTITVVEPGRGGIASNPKYFTVKFR